MAQAVPVAKEQRKGIMNGQTGCKMVCSPTNRWIDGLLHCLTRLIEHAIIFSLQLVGGFMEYLYSTFLLLIFTFLIVTITKKRFEFSFMAVVFGVILLYYTLGLVDLLRYAPMLMAGLAFASIVFSIVWLLKKKKQVRQITSAFFTPGFLAFMLFFFINYFINHGQLVCIWDEMSHWGLIAKIMFYTRNFGNRGDYTIIFYNYPPATALFESFYLWNTNKTVFLEQNLYLAKAIYQYALVLPLFTLCTWKTWKRIIPILILSFFVPLVFFSDHYTSLLVDSLLGLIFFHVMYVLMTRNIHAKSIKDGISTSLYIAMALCVLSLTKSSGLGLSVLLWLSMVMLYLSECSLAEYPQRKSNWHNLILLSIPLCGILFAKFSWEAYLNIYHITQTDATTGVSLGALVALFSGKAPVYQYNIISTFITTLFSSTSNNLFTINVFSWLLIFIFMSVIIYNYYSGQEGLQKRRSNIILHALILCFLVYVAILLSLYLFKFGEYEGTRLASFDRYMNTMKLGIFFSLCGYFLYLSVKHAKRGLFHFTSAILICFILLFSQNTIPSIIYARNQIADRQSVRNDYQYIESYCSNLDQERTRIWFIDQNSTGFTYYTAHFVALPVQIYNEYFSWSIGKKYSDEDIWTNESLDLAGWQSALQKDHYTHVLLHHVDAQFIKTFAPLFANPSAIQDHTLYFVRQTKNGICLVKEP